MNVSVTYSKFSIHHLAAVAAACIRNVRLFENDKNILSMGPYCRDVTSQNSITSLILNFDPLEVNTCNDLIFETKNIKPCLFNLYKNCANSKFEMIDSTILQNLVNKINERFGNQLQTLCPLALVLWADLYILLSNQSPLCKAMNLSLIVWPTNIINWFNDLNALPPLRRAITLCMGEDELYGLTVSIANLPNLKVFSLCPEIKLVPCSNSIIKTNYLHGHFKITPLVPFLKPKLPCADQRNILITSALPYVNNVPHLGNLIGSTLSADIFSRYCRKRGYNSLYVCGTDEYGTATEVKAAADKVSPKEICDRYHKIHTEVYKWFDIDFDIFGRTSNDEHAILVTEVFNDIYKRGFILEKSVPQLLCESCDKFLADRFVEGGCPNKECVYSDARGDQCDKCGKLINAIELINPRCKICSSTPQIRTSNHLFLDLTKIQENLESFLNETMNAVDCIWSTNAKSITTAWLKEGLEPRCITRDLKWGVKVPIEEFTNKVFYVWFDAVLGYLSMTSTYTKDWKQWWLKDHSKGEVQLYQFMAKDNVPFHSVILPANLIATGKSYTKLKQLASTEYLNYEHDKFSKSRGLGVFGLDAKDSGIDADIWRFYLVSCRPESQDSSFTWDNFAACNNSDLLNNLGNFINRSLLFVVKFFDGCIPNFFDELIEDDYKFISEINHQLTKYVEQMEQTKLREALFTILNISRLGNGYFQRNKPWVDVKDVVTRSRAGVVISVAANVSLILGVVLSPIMPKVSLKILDQCKAPESSQQIFENFELLAFLQPGHMIGDVTPLFNKIEPDFIIEMKKKFGTSS